jgi:cell cycle checkpoint protein
MESSLQQIWADAAGSPFVTPVGKDSQFFVGFSLLVAGILLSGLFGMSKRTRH